MEKEDQLRVGEETDISFPCDNLKRLYVRVMWRRKIS